MSQSVTQGIGSVLRPRMRVLIAGIPTNSLVSCSVERNNYARGDTFHCDMIPDKGATWFDMPDGDIPLDVTIQGLFLPESAPEGSAAGWVTLIQGGADTIRPDPIRNMVSLDGRDYSSKLIELSTGIDVYLNKRSDEVAEILASAAGMTANTVRTTTGFVGQYYQIDHKRHGLVTHSKQTTGWDLLMRLARIERYDVWVSGKTLNFVPQLSDTTPGVPLAISTTGPIPVSPVTNLTLEKQAGVTRGIKVQVLSWDSKQRTVTTGNWPPVGSSYKVKPNAQQYTFKAPNLNIGDANDLAKAYYTLIAAHQRTITFSQPGDFTLSPRQSVQLSGVSKNWDSKYRIDSISRTYSMQDGLSQTITLRNRDLVASEVDGTEDGL